MLLAWTQEHIAAFVAADRIVGCNRDKIPNIHIEGIKEVVIDWSALEKQYRKRKPDPQKVNCIFWKDTCSIEKDEELYKSESKVRVIREGMKKSFVPLQLPPPDIIEKDGKRIGVVLQDAITAVISAVPKGCVVTKSRAKDFLVIVYTLYYGNIPFDTEKNWEGYRLNDTDYGYSLNHHRLVSDEGEINGNGMSWRYRGKTWNRRRDAETLSHEGVPTFEANYRCYVDSLEKWEYDFDDLFVVVEKERNNYSDDKDEDLTG